MSRISATRAIEACTDIITRIQKARGYTDPESLDLTTTFMKGKTSKSRPLTFDRLGCVKGLSDGVSDDIMNIYRKHQSTPRSLF